MQSERVWIWSTTETPTCGSGRRVVTVEVGRKWVKIYRCPEKDCHPDRLLRSDYERIYQGPAV